jgi:hypothetical protein
MKNQVKLTKTVKGLPYKVGDIVPVTMGIKGLYLWHVGIMIIELPKGSYQEPLIKGNLIRNAVWN